MHSLYRRKLVTLACLSALTVLVQLNVQPVLLVMYGILLVLLVHLHAPMELIIMQQLLLIFI